MENTCLTYFFIRGEFDPDVITARLGIKPSKTIRSTDLRRNGKPMGYSIWECGRCEEYDVYTDNQMMQTIAPLLDKKEILKQIKSELDAEFWLEVVPTVVCGNSTPCLAPSLDVMQFCCDTGTEIDIDMYLMEE